MTSDGFRIVSDTLVLYLLKKKKKKKRRIRKIIIRRNLAASAYAIQGHLNIM